MASANNGGFHKPIKRDMVLMAAAPESTFKRQLSCDGPMVPVKMWTEHLTCYIDPGILDESVDRACTRCHKDHEWPGMQQLTSQCSLSGKCDPVVKTHIMLEACLTMLRLWLHGLED